MKCFRILFFVLLFLPVALWSQDTYKPVDFSLQLKNNHLWRGLEVSPEITLATDINLKDRNNMFKLGLWGGAGATGKFKEFDYYFSFSKAGFTFAVWDIYNFSPGVAHNNTDVFNYVADETGHFVDVSVAYQFPKAFPLSISWSTVVFGRDRGVSNEKNLYSTYVSLGYPVLRHGAVDVDLGIAGAFALSKEKGSDATFYGKDPGIVNVNVTVSKVLQLGNYKLPVSAMAMWNPVNKYANIQLALNLFGF